MANEPRVALVIGNSSYTVSPLKNPANDADDIAQALQALNFRVTRLNNATNRQMVEAINAFGQELRKGGVGLFFFAGHGVQSRGRNYLIPVGANISSEDQLEFESVDANRVLAAMDAAGNRVNIVILDACRDNPYARSFRSASRGLAQMEAARGSFIAFATAPGSTAADGTGRNGLYTQHLLRSLKEPDSDIDKVFRRVTAEVSRASAGRQVPWIAHSLTGDFYFRLEIKVPASAPGAIADPRADDRALWETVKDSNNPDELRAYLEQFPNGLFAAVARARLKSLASTGRPPAASAPPPQVVTVAPPTPVAVPPSPATALAGSLQNLTPGTVFRDCDDCPEMVVIAAGSFTMGAPASEQGSRAVERPLHQVTISRRFAAGKFEVTRGEFARFVAETSHATSGGCHIWTGREAEMDVSKDWRNPGYSQTDGDPVACVNWQDAKAYTQWLSTKAGKAYRLLAEAEWEYVARAGTTTPFNTGPNINPTQANYRATASYAGSVTGTWRQQTVPVGSFQPNAFGLYDVHGNVWEWTEDCFNVNYQGAPDDGSAQKRDFNCSPRVLRGGSWFDTPQLLRSAVRGNFNPSYRYFSLGLRLARTD
jgi:formylglycine-generating enzyme required for sulfatase activity